MDTILHGALANSCCSGWCLCTGVLMYWQTGKLDIILQHWQIHAALAAISQSWWRGREGRGLCFLITSKCTPCRWMLMIAAIMRWRKNLRLQNWCKGLLVLVIVIKRTVFKKKHLERICYVTMRKYWPRFQFSLSPQCCIGSFQLLPIYVTQCNSQQTNKPIIKWRSTPKSPEFLVELLFNNSLTWKSEQWMLPVAMYCRDDMVVTFPQVAHYPLYDDSIPSV